MHVRIPSQFPRDDHSFLCSSSCWRLLPSDDVVAVFVDGIAPSVFIFPDLLTTFRQHLTKCECHSTPASQYYTDMLTPPERQTFEQIRARWEAAQPSEQQSANMVGRKVSQQSAGGEAHDSAGSKFRRKLSHGLASISNTWSARKTTPSRQPVIHPPLAVTAPSPTAISRQYDAPLSPTPKPASERSIGSPTKTVAPVDRESPTKRDDPDATPKVPRSRTTSFLPRPVKLDSEASVTDLARAARVISPPLVTNPNLRAMPSKIPTPSPPLSQRRVSSPRQHISHYTSVGEKHVAVGFAFARKSTGSPSNASARSRTTPNLVKAVNISQPANFMAPRRPGVRRPLTSPAVQKPALQENIPTNRRVTQRHSHVPDKTPRRDSLAVSSTLTPRRSFGPGSPLSQSKQSDRGTPLTAKKRVSSNLAPQTPRTPHTARRAQPSEQIVANTHEPVFVTSSSSIAQPRLMGPRNAPTPTPLNTEAASARPAVPRSSTDKDLQRKTLGTPNGLGGVWRSSRALAAANHEVRLPRSSTFHNFGRSWEAAPPVPPIPDQYRTASLSHLGQSAAVVPENSYRSEHLRMVSDAASCESVPEENGEDIIPDGFAMSAQTGHAIYSSSEPSDSSDDLVALLKAPRGGRSTPAPLSTWSQSSQASLLRTQNERPWSISNLHCERSADVEPHLQVRDYMPPLYWAGRFQSRYDQWRTNAMHAELNPGQEPEGQLGHCKLSQEKIAACYIFAQLRDLCLTGQAADSLWVSIIPLFSTDSNVTTATDFMHRFSSRDTAKTTNCLAIPSIQCNHPVGTTSRVRRKERSDAPSGS